MVELELLQGRERAVAFLGCSEPPLLSRTAAASCGPTPLSHVARPAPPPAWPTQAGGAAAAGVSTDGRTGLGEVHSASGPAQRRAGRAARRAHRQDREGWRPRPAAAD